MAFENLFIRNKRSIGGIEIDGVIVERFSNAVRLTQNPVELGVNITDHAIIEPKLYNIDGVVTDTPLGVASLGVIVDNITGLFGDSTGDGLTRSEAAYQAIQVLMNEREPISVQSGLELLENMMITRFDVSRDKDTSRAIFFNMDLAEVIIAQTEVVERPEDSLEGDARMGGATPVNQGRQLKQELPADDRSILAKGLDYFSN